MSDKLTRITLRGWSGLLDWGKKTPEEMIHQARKHAEYLRAEAAKIDAAADADFKIDVVKGSMVQHHIKTLQEGKRHS